MTPTVATLGAPLPARRSLVRIGVIVTGLALGFALSRIGFTDYDALVGMFTFADLRMFLVFAGGVALTAVGLEIVRRVRREPRSPSPRLRASVVGGGVLFGIGWAVAGACPGVAFVQVGEGKLWAFVTIAGMALGTLAFHRVRGRLGLATERDGCGVG